MAAQATKAMVVVIVDQQPIKHENNIWDRIGPLDPELGNFFLPSFPSSFTS